MFQVDAAAVDRPLAGNDGNHPRRPEMKLRSSLLLAIAAAGAAALLGTAWLWFAGAPAAQRSTALPVTIAVSTAYAGSCPVLAASDRGYFKAEGVAATLQPHSSGKSALNAVLEGKAELATVAELPVMFAAMGGQPVMVLANMFRAERDSGIIVRRDRGIAAPADLKGKRVGVQMGTAAHFMLEIFLYLNKLSVRDVTLVDLQTHELSNALSRGVVDAVATWEPYLDSMRTMLGSNGTLFYGERVYSYFLLAGMRDHVRAQPQAVQGVLRAVLRGARYCAEVPAAAAALLASPAKPARTAELWRDYRFDVSLEQSLLLALEDESRWAIQNKLVADSTMPNFLNHLHLDALAAVRPAAVTVIH
jgi:NitT/TauT family transport system substrate-binding protein